MPAIDTYGTRKTKRGRPAPRYTKPKARPKVVYGPPAPKRVVYGPPAPKRVVRTPRAPTPAERTTARSRAKVVRIKGEIERKTPDLQSERAVERFKQSKAYIDAVQKAREARIATAPAKERRRNKWQGESLKLNPLARVSAREELRARDFEARNRAEAGYDEPRTNAELREFLKSGTPPKRKATATGKAKAEQAERIAPVLKVIDLTARPLYAEAGAASAALKGKSLNEIQNAAARGIKGEERKTFSTVLREHGAPRGLAAAAGLAADIGLDPLTYTSGGVAPVARKAARKAAADAAKRAAEKGASEALAERLAARTEARVLAAGAPKGKGVVVRFAGRGLPGVTRGTAAVSRGVKTGARKVTPKAARAGKLRHYVRKTVRPSLRPGGVSEQAFTVSRQAARRGRTHVKNQEARALVLARELKAKLPAEDYAAVIDAIERDNLRKLPPHIGNDKKLRAVVHDLRSAMKGAYRQGRRAGALKGKVGDTGYLTSADTKRLRRTIKGEQGVQARRVAQLTRHEQRAAAREAIAEEAAKGSAGRKAAVETERLRQGAGRVEAIAVERAKREAAIATERARGRSALTAKAEQHVADVEFERAHAGARVSVAKPKAELVPHQRNLVAAKVAHDTAKTSLRHAKAHLRRVLARPNRQRKHVASAYAKVVRAQTRADTARAVLHDARTTLRAERKRTAGVAPTEADRLLGAVERRGRVKPAPGERVAPAATPRQQARVLDRQLRGAEQAAVERAPALLRPLREAEAKAAQAARRPVAPRVEPELPGGLRLANAAARRRERIAQLETAKARHEAAKHIPERGLNETHEAYVRRVIEHAEQHDLPLVKARAEKLLAKRPTDIAKGYFPRDFDDRVLKQLGIKSREVEGHAFAKTGAGRKVARITPGFKRAEKRRLSTVNPEREAAEQTPFSTDVPLVTLNHLKSVARAVSQGEFHKELAGIGRAVRVTRDADGKIVQPTLREGEAIYKLGAKDGQFGLHEVGAVSSRGQFVALDKTLADEMLGAVKQISEPLMFARGFDRATGALKRVMTATLGFHIRNMVSDLGQSYLETPGHRLPGNVKQAGTAARRAHQQGTEWRPTAPSTKTIKVAGKPVPVDDFLKDARREGVLDAGYIGRELDDLSGQGVDRAGKVKGTGRVRRFGQKLDRVMTSRENLMRLATYKAGLDRGLSSAAAADVANKIHVDYNDLTDFERRLMRRVFPFYTWTARSLPLAAETLVRSPGKYATIEKIRQEVGQATTGQSEDEQRASMTEAVQRGYPLVIGKRAVGLGLPQTLLNEVPAGTSPGAFLKELDRFGWGMANQLIRSPLEASANRNMVTKADIEKQQGKRLVAAPSWVGKLPESVKAKLDVQPPKGKGPRGIGYTDPRSGRPSWAWRGRADWTYDQLMLGFVGQLAAIAGQGRSQATTIEQGVGALGGLKLDPLNQNMRQRAADQAQRVAREKGQRRLDILNELGVNVDNPTAEYTRLRAKINAWDRAKSGAKAKRPTSIDILGGSGRGGGGGDILGGGGAGGGTLDILK
jgi:hypothetical protein